jgi:excisionase family DNA binding protein
METEVHMPMDGRKLFDIPSAVAYLRAIGAESATISFVRMLINTGQVPHLRIGKKFHITREALDHWISNHERRR